jgi:hypothetical protein
MAARERFYASQKQEIAWQGSPDWGKSSITEEFTNQDYRNFMPQPLEEVYVC